MSLIVGQCLKKIQTVAEKKYKAVTHVYVNCVMKTQSAKAKGRRLQQWVRDLLIEELEIHPEDVESRSMGAGGEDLILSLIHI